MAVSEWQGGEVLFAGGTDFAQLMKTTGKGKGKNEVDPERAKVFPNLPEPHRLNGLMDVKITWIASGCSAFHCLAGDAAGKLYTWGRNEKGQLGHGDTTTRNTPTVLQRLADDGVKVIGGAAGKFHTSIVTEEGQSYTFGSNLQGQCGTGSMKSKPQHEELLMSPVKAAVAKGCSMTACGQEFTLWLCEGKVYAAGSPQYGQLGDGSDHQYNTKDSSIKLAYDPQPRPLLVEALVKHSVMNIACGQNHSIAVDDDGHCYTWGFGGYGRLGHKVQQDEFKPRLVETLTNRQTVPKDAKIACGQVTSFCTVTAAHLLFAWGRLKTSGDNWMYPNMMQDLCGWDIQSIACGPTTYAIAAIQDGKHSTITWGAAHYNELGYGSSGKKSSANPDKCMPLEGIKTQQVACGSGFTLFLVDADTDTKKKFPMYRVDEEAAAELNKAAATENGAATKAAANKRKAPAASAKGKKAKAK